MSGICGIWNRDGRPMAPEHIEAMMAAMRYWGPDGATSWQQGPVFLGQLSLHGTPESTGDTLPRTSFSGHEVLVAHARLDNRRDLCNLLAVPDTSSPTVPDSLLLLQAYSKWGEECPRQLLGDWCFAVWDSVRQQLFLARDHYGNTGLYYYQNRRFLAFASCLKGLLALPDVVRKPNPLPIAQVLLSWPKDGEATCYQDIRRLPPAHCLTVTATDYRPRQYWFLEDTPPLRLKSDDEYLEAFIEIYSEAVRCRMRSLRPVATTLSGGLDSGSVAAIAAHALGLQGGRLRAFSSIPLHDVSSLTPKSQFGDETPFIEATSRHAGNIDVTYIHAETVSPIQGIKQALFLQDEPGHAAANDFWIVSLLQTAQAMGIGTVLTGQAGNASVSWDAYGSLGYWAMTGKWRDLGRELAGLRATTGRPWWRLLAGRVVRPLLQDFLIKKWQRLRQSEAPWMHYSAINRDLAQTLQITAKMRHSGHDPTFTTIYNQRQARLKILGPGSSIIGFLWQETGAGHGIEIRDPTADKRVLEFCLAIPDNQYVRNGQDRWLIRRAMRGRMPPLVLDNHKRGLQAADIGRRVLDHYDEAAAALQDLKNSALANHYLDLPLMRSSLENTRNRLDIRSSREVGDIFLRGVMTGLFLKRFE